MICANRQRRRDTFCFVPSLVLALLSNHQLVVAGSDLATVWHCQTVLVDAAVQRRLDLPGVLLMTRHYGIPHRTVPPIRRYQPLSRRERVRIILAYIVCVAVVAVIYWPIVSHWGR